MEMSCCGTDGGTAMATVVEVAAPSAETAVVVVTDPSATTSEVDGAVVAGLVVGVVVVAALIGRRLLPSPPELAG